jgi:CDP-4-dehydro-6-deoxyglucose reductase
MSATIRLQPSGHEVICDSGDTVLSALEKAGYIMPNNCRAGACGECKTKVLDGAFDQGMVWIWLSRKRIGPTAMASCAWPSR